MDFRGVSTLFSLFEILDRAHLICSWCAPDDPPPAAGCVPAVLNSRSRPLSPHPHPRNPLLLPVLSPQPWVQVPE